MCLSLSPDSRIPLADNSSGRRPPRRWLDASHPSGRTINGAVSPDAESIYESIGVRPLINARGTVTIVGASRTLPEVKRAMEDAARDYVQIDELMEGVGRRLVGLTGAEQKGHEVLGSHHGGFTTRDINGALHGRDLVLRSSYTEQGVRLNFTFTGTVSVDGKTLEGKVSLGEYSRAEWKATRR